MSSDAQTLPRVGKSYGSLEISISGQKGGKENITP